MITIQKRLVELTEIAERSPGYKVTAVEDGKLYELTDLAFDRHYRSGRRNKSVVVCNSNGRPARFNSDEMLSILD